VQCKSPKKLLCFAESFVFCLCCDDSWVSLHYKFLF
jgi:hypothetical protein